MASEFLREYADDGLKTSPGGSGFPLTPLQAGMLYETIATGNPDIIYYPIFIAEGGFVTTQAKEVAGLEDTVLAGADGMISPDFISAAGDAAAIDIDSCFWHLEFFACDCF